MIIFNKNALSVFPFVEKKIPKPILCVVHGLKTRECIAPLTIAASEMSEMYLQRLQIGGERGKKRARQFNRFKRTCAAFYGFFWFC